MDDHSSPHLTLFDNVDHWLSSIELESIIRRAISSDDSYAQYDPSAFKDNLSSFGCFQVFRYSIVSNENSNVRCPTSLDVALVDGDILRSYYTSNEAYIRGVHVIINTEGCISDLMVVCFYKNEQSCQFSGVPLTFNKYQMKEILEKKYRPSAKLLPILLGESLWNNYFYVLDGNVFTPTNIVDGLNWNCRADGADRIRTSFRSRTFPQCSERVGIKENQHVNLPILRRIFWMTDANKNRYGDIVVQYIACNDLDGLNFELPETKSRMDKLGSAKVKELLSNRTVTQAFAENIKLEHGFTKVQVRNAARYCDSVQKGRHGRKPIDNIERDHAGAFVPSSNVQMMFIKDMTGRVNREILSIFEDQIMLCLQQATTGAELRTLRALCDIVENMEDREEQLTFLNKYIIPHQDNSGYLKWGTVMMVDTTFGLTKTHVVTIIVGLVRGFKTKASQKPKYVILSVMAHQQQNAQAHMRHVAAFQNVYNSIVERFPQLADRHVTALITDGEKALKNEFSKLTFCQSAQVLGCAFHLKRNLKGCLIQKRTMCKLFGTVRNGILSGALLSALNYNQFQEYLFYLKQSTIPKEYDPIFKRAIDMFKYFSCIKKLRGGIASQYATTNQIENINATLKLAFPGPVSAGYVTTKIRELSDAVMHEMTDAATTTSDRITCDKPIWNWKHLSEAKRDMAIGKRFLKPLLDPELASLPSLFVSAVGPLLLNSTIKARNNKDYKAYVHEDCVIIVTPKDMDAPEPCMISIERNTQNNEDDVRLVCPSTKCQRSADFCYHRLQALLSLTVQERDAVVQSYLNNETHVDYIFQKQKTAKEGHKPCKRTFEPMSYVNRPRKVIQMKDKSFITEGLAEQESESEEDCEVYTVDLDIADVLRKPPPKKQAEWALELTDGEDCDSEEEADPDTSEYIDDNEHQKNRSCVLYQPSNEPTTSKTSKYVNFIEQEKQQLLDVKRKERDEKNKDKLEAKRLEKEEKAEAKRLEKEKKAKAKRLEKEEKAEAARMRKVEQITNRKNNRPVDLHVGDESFLSRGDPNEFISGRPANSFQPKQLKKKEVQNKIRLLAIQDHLPNEQSKPAEAYLQQTDVDDLHLGGSLNLPHSAPYTYLRRRGGVLERSLTLRPRRPLADITNGDQGILFDSNINSLNSNDSVGLFFDSDQTGFYEQGPENIKKAQDLMKNREKLLAKTPVEKDPSIFVVQLLESEAQPQIEPIADSEILGENVSQARGSRCDRNAPVKLKPRGRPKKTQSDDNARGGVSEKCSDLLKVTVPRTRKGQHTPISKISCLRSNEAAPAIPLTTPRSPSKKERHVPEGQVDSEKCSDLLEVTVPRTRSKRGQVQIITRSKFTSKETSLKPKKRKSSDIFKSPGIQSKKNKLAPKTSTPIETSRNPPDFRNSKDLPKTVNSSMSSLGISPVRPSSLDESKDRDRGRSAANWSAISSWVESPPAAPYVFDPRFNDSNESTGDETTFVVPEYIDIPNDSCSYQAETSQD